MAILFIFHHLVDIKQNGTYSNQIKDWRSCGVGHSCVYVCKISTPHSAINSTNLLHDQACFETFTIFLFINTVNAFVLKLIGLAV